MADSDSEHSSEQEVASEATDTTNSGIMALEYESTSFEEQDIGNALVLPSQFKSSDDDVHYETDSLENGGESDEEQGQERPTRLILW